MFYKSVLLPRFLRLSMALNPPLRHVAAPNNLVGMQVGSWWYDARAHPHPRAIRQHMAINSVMLMRRRGSRTAIHDEVALPGPDWTTGRSAAAADRPWQKGSTATTASSNTVMAPAAQLASFRASLLSFDVDDPKRPARVVAVIMSLPQALPVRDGLTRVKEDTIAKPQVPRQEHRDVRGNTQRLEACTAQSLFKPKLHDQPECL